MQRDFPPPRLILALAGAYASMAWCSFMLALPPGVICPIWPPSGIAAAALLLGGPGLWPGVLAGSLLANTFAMAPAHGWWRAAAMSVVIGAGSAVQALVLRRLVLAWAGERFLDTPMGVMRFAGAALAGCLVAATAGVSALSLGGAGASAGTFFSWYTWYAGDLVGVLIWAPLFVAHATFPAPERPMETAFLAAGGALLAGLTFSNPPAWGVLNYRFLLLPLVVLAAFRAGQRGATIVGAAVTAVVVLVTAAGIGPFADMLSRQGLVTLQGYLASMCFSGLAVAAAVERYEQTERELRRARSGLLEAVRQRTALLADAETVAGLGSWSWDLDHSRMEFSEGLKVLFGLAPDVRVSSDTLLDLVDPPDRQKVREAVDQAMRKGAYEIEYSVTLPDGQRRIVVSRGRVLLGREGRPARMIGTIQDVTARRRAESALRELDAVREKDRLQRDFMANVSHELRTPIASILGFGETLLRGALEDKENRREFVETIHRNASWLARLVEDLLDMAAVDSGKKPPRLETVTLAVVVAEARRNMESLAAARGVVIEEGAGLSEAVRADRDHLRRILQNGLDNAVKFSGQGGRVRVAAERREGRVALTVRDEGCGIPAHEVPQLFQRFHRAAVSRDRVGGTGLGLAIVKQLAEANGGAVSIESELGRGTTLKVELPVA